MTRAEFLNFISKNDKYLFCPKELGLINYNKLCHCGEEIRINCWEKAIKDIKFKGDNMEKKDLKNGMVVETRDGNRYIAFEDRIINNMSWLGLNQYFHDLTFSNINNVIIKNYCQYDIVKIFKTSGKSLHSMIDDINLKIIWQRSVVDWSKVEVDTKMQEWDDEFGKWKNCYFADYLASIPHSWHGGKTSFTTTTLHPCLKARLYKEGDKN